MSGIYSHPNGTAIVSYPEMWMVQSVDQGGAFFVSLSEDGGAADTGRALSFGADETARDLEFLRIALNVPRDESPWYLHPAGDTFIRFDRMDMVEKKSVGDTHSIVFNGLTLSYADEATRDAEFDAVAAIRATL